MRDAHLIASVALFLLLLLNGLAVIPISYALSGISSKPSNGFAIIVVAYIVTGIIFTIAQTINASLISNQGGGISQETYDLISWLFRISPIFSMSWGITKLVKSGITPALCSQVPYDILNKTCSSMVDKWNPVTPCCFRISPEYCTITLANG